ncbi:MAG: hypothetical protein ACTSQP_08635 [Promethearchaeota archaeon]
MSESDKQNDDILIKINQLIEKNELDIERIDKSHPLERAKFYNKLREIIERFFPEEIDIIKFAGKEAIDELEKRLIKENDIEKLKILKIVRAIFYC